MRKGIVFLSVFCLWTSLTHAATRYVQNGASGGCANGSTNYRPATNDCGGGGTDTVYSSINNGVNAIAGGDILLIRAGTYNEHLNNNTIPSGSSSQRTVLRAYTGETVNLQPSSAGRIVNIIGRSWIEFDRINLLGGTGVTGNAVQLAESANNNYFHDLEVTNNGTTSSNSHHCFYVGGATTNSDGNLFQRLKIHDCIATGYGPGDIGIYIGGTNTIVEYCEIYWTAPVGSSRAQNPISFFSQGATIRPSGNIARYNYLHDGYAGVQVEGTNNLVYRNLITGMSTYGIRLFVTFGTSENKLYHNTIGGTPTYGIDIPTSATNTIIQNNIVPGSAGRINATAGQSTTCTTNRLSSGTTTPCDTNTGNTVGAFGHMNTGSVDYGLTSSSAALDGGTVIASCPAGVSCAYNGTAPDMGAFETLTLPTSSCTVNDGDANKVHCTWQNNVHPSIASCTAANFVVTANGSGRTSTDCTVTGSNQVDVTFDGAAVAGGQAVTLAYTAGTLRDSMDLGRGIQAAGSGKHQTAHSVSAGYAVTNLVSASTPTLTQANCVFESWGGTEAAPNTWPTGGTVTLAKNKNMTVRPGACGRVRVNITNGVADKGVTAFAAFVKKNAGAYAALPNGPCATGAACFGTPPELGSGPTTEQLTASPANYVAGGVQLTASEVPNVSLTNGKSVEFTAPWCLASDVVAGDAFSFRWYQAGGVALDTYSNTCTATVGNGSFGIGGD